MAVKTLIDLADQINAEHLEALRAAHSALHHAAEAGRMLREAKRQCKHGEWLPWLQAHFDGSKRTAQAYMRLANNWPAIKAKAQGSAHLSIDAALHLLSDERRKEPSDQPAKVGEFELPPLDPARKYFGAGKSDCMEITPSKQTGYWYIGHSHDLDSDHSSVDYTARPIAAEAVPFAVQSVFRFKPIAPWGSRPHSGEKPWYITAPGKPARAYR